jgi:hypothetical protein
MRLLMGENGRNAPLHRGERVTLRSPQEILDTLDATGSLDGVPFMPEMLAFFGRAHTVSSRLERACDAVDRVRRMPDAVLLEDLRCDGSGHDGCQAGCRIFWKERWLRRVGDDEALELRADGALERLREVSLANVRRGQASSEADENDLYRCQATEFLDSTEPIPRWDLKSLVGEVTSRNVSVWTFVRVMFGIVVDTPRRRRGQMPFRRAGSGVGTATSPDLRPGAKVRVKSAEEIAESLDASSRLRGLWFDREMVPYCGRSAVVKTKVERFIDEKTGRMNRITSDCYILEGVVCKGNISDGRWFCRREIYPWWRNAWLELEADVEAESGAGDADALSGRDATPATPS